MRHHLRAGSTAEGPYNLSGGRQGTAPGAEWSGPGDHRTGGRAPLVRLTGVGKAYGSVVALRAVYFGAKALVLDELAHELETAVSGSGASAAHEMTEEAKRLGITGD